MEYVLPPFEVAILFCNLVASIGVQMVFGVFYVFYCYLEVSILLGVMLSIMAFPFSENLVVF